MFENHGKNPEGGKMGSTWTEWKTAEKPKNTLEMLLARYNRKVFLHRIVTGDEKWIYSENPSVASVYKNFFIF